MKDWQERAGLAELFELDRGFQKWRYNIKPVISAQTKTCGNNAEVEGLGVLRPGTPLTTTPALRCAAAMLRRQVWERTNLLLSRCFNGSVFRDGTHSAGTSLSSLPAIWTRPDPFLPLLPDAAIPIGQTCCGAKLYRSSTSASQWGEINAIRNRTFPANQPRISFTSIHKHRSRLDQIVAVYSTFVAQGTREANERGRTLGPTSLE